MSMPRVCILQMILLSRRLFDRDLFSITGIHMMLSHVTQLQIAWRLKRTSVEGGWLYTVAAGR